MICYSTGGIVASILSIILSKPLFATFDSQDGLKGGENLILLIFLTILTCTTTTSIGSLAIAAGPLSSRIGATLPDRRKAAFNAYLIIIPLSFTIALLVLITRLNTTWNEGLLKNQEIFDSLLDSGSPGFQKLQSEIIDIAYNECTRLRVVLIVFIIQILALHTVSGSSFSCNFDTALLNTQ